MDAARNWHNGAMDVVSRRRSDEPDELLGRLREAVRGEVDASARRRAEYATDASN